MTCALELEIIDMNVVFNIEFNIYLIEINDRCLEFFITNNMTVGSETEYEK